MHPGSQAFLYWILNTFYIIAKIMTQKQYLQSQIRNTKNNGHPLCNEADKKALITYSFLFHFNTPIHKNL